MYRFRAEISEIQIFSTFFYLPLYLCIIKTIYFSA